LLFYIIIEHLQIACNFQRILLLLSQQKARFKKGENVKIRKGTNRIVIISIGSVVKFPRFYVRHFFIDFFKFLKYGPKQAWKLMTYGLETYWGFTWSFFKGIVDNWLEFVFYQTYKLPITVPTYFSLFGLVNFQATGEKLEMKGVDLWVQMVKLTKGECWANAHHFAEPENYQIINGKIAMVDYGDFRTFRVLLKYWRVIYEQFDLSFDRKKVKK